MKREVKTYDLKNGVGIDCITIENEFLGTKRYEVNVVMLDVPWREKMDSHKVSTPEEANAKFKEMVEKYKKMERYQ